MVAAAVRQVTDSKAAKEQADAEAAAQAQAPAAAAAAQSQRSYSQSYNRYGGSSRGYSSNRGYSAPKQSYTPSNNGGSSTGGSNLADLIGAASGGQGIGPSDGSTGISYHLCLFVFLFSSFSLISPISSLRWGLSYASQPCQ